MRPRLIRTCESLQRGLQILIVGWRPLVQNHEIDVEVLHPPIFVGAYQFANDFQVFGLVDPHQHDRQVAGDSVGPQLRRSALASLQNVGRGPQRRIGVEHAIGETLEEMRFVGTDAEVMELHLRLGPRERHRALEGGGVVMLVHQVECFGASRCNHRPERDVDRGARRYSHAAAKTEDRIEHGADGIGERLAVDHRDRRANDAPASQGNVRGRFRTVASPADSPSTTARCAAQTCGIGGRARPPRGQQRADVGLELRLHEHFGEGRMGGVGCVGRQHDFGVRGQLDLARAGAEIRDRDAANFGVIFGRDRHFQRGRDRAVASSRSRRDPPKIPLHNCPASTPIG